MMQRTKKERPLTIVRFIQVAMVWRHLKPLTIMGAALGVIAFVEQNPPIYLAIFAWVVAGLLLLGAFYTTFFKSED